MATHREEELARLRAERQAERREAEQAARRRQRNAVLASVAAVGVVAGVVGVLAARGGGDSETDTAAPAPAASASPSPAPDAAPSPAPARGTCTYTKTGSASRPVDLPPSTPVAKGSVTATMTTDRGVLTWSLDGAKAPCTTNALVSLAAQEFYDDTPCHRLTTSGIFVLQCGDPTGTGSGGPGYQYAEEALEGATYPRGTVAMAKSTAPGSTGSQFFLVYQDTPLPPQYTPVGRVTKGLEVLDAVAKGGATPEGDGAPKNKVTIKTLRTAAA